MSIGKNIQTLLETREILCQQGHRLAAEVSLVAVSKGRSIQEIEETYRTGCRDFGESRVQEALEKIEQLPSDIRWHFIGRLQKNKVNKVVGRFALIHAVDSWDLAEKISISSLAKEITSSVLCAVNTSGEKTKAGFSPIELENVFMDLLHLKGIEIQGLMTMAPLTEDEGIIRHCFSELRFLRDRLQFIAKERANLTTLSMGMSHDYPLAILEGSTLIRIGTKVFDLS